MIAAPTAPRVPVASGCPKCGGFDRVNCSVCHDWPTVDDLVSMTDHGGRTWTGGLVTAIADVIYVRWPDGIVGQFRRHHARRLTVTARAAR